MAGYRHYKRSARRTWRHPPDASVRLAAQRRAAPRRAGHGRAQSAERTNPHRRCGAQRIAHSAHRPAGCGQGGARKTAKEESARPSNRANAGSWSERVERESETKHGRARETTENAKERREREDKRERVDGRTDERTDGRACGRMCESANGGGRIPVRERDGARVEGQRASERGLVARFGTV